MIYNLKAHQIIALLKKREISSKEIVQSFIDNINRLNPKVDALLEVYEEKAIKKAIEIDDRLKYKDIRSLESIPVVIKDNILSEGDKTTACSKMLSNYIAPYNATVVNKLEENGAIIIGKATMDEFAMGSSGEYSAYKIAKNPWDLSKVPGGSSSGSASSVAANMSPIALGSETGGSVRQPSAFCGLVGLKPTYGRVSRFGLIAMTSSLDQIAPFAKDVEDIALVMNNISGYDPLESTSSKIQVPNYSDFLNKDISNMKIAFLKSDILKYLDKDIEEAYYNTIKHLEEMKVTLEEVEINNIENSIEVYYTINPSEVSSNLSRFDGLKYGIGINNPKSIADLYEKSRTIGLGSEVKRRIMIGNYVLSSENYETHYLQACKVRNIIKSSFDNLFEKFDAILMPTTPTKAFPFGERVKDPLKMYLSDIFTIPANLTGSPAISIPVAIKDNLPIGMQLIACNFREDNIIKISSALEKKIGLITELKI